MPEGGSLTILQVAHGGGAGASTVRVSGSVLHGNDSESDVDPFVDIRRGATVLDMVRLQNAIAQEPGSLLTCSVRAISATISNKPARSGKMERIKPAPAHRSSARARSPGESPD
jgi:predicted nucleotidyltransferase